MARIDKVVVVVTNGVEFEQESKKNIVWVVVTMFGGVGRANIGRTQLRRSEGVSGVHRKERRHEANEESERRGISVVYMWTARQEMAEVLAFHPHNGLRIGAGAAHVVR
jgi:hypothetical protein